jgi:hypothetical protein
MTLRAIPTLLAAFVLAGCATDDGPREPPRPSGPPRLFISPAGQAFRIGADGVDPLELWWRQADANGDGAVTATEMTVDFNLAFRTFDTDGDRVISDAEIIAWEESLPEVMGLYGGENRARGFSMAGGAARYGLLGDQQPLRSADTDLSQSVTLAEFGARAARVFSLLDANHDGRILRAELPPRPRDPPRRPRRR